MAYLIGAVVGLLVGWLLARGRYRSRLRRAYADAQLSERTRAELEHILRRLKAL